MWWLPPPWHPSHRRKFWTHVSEPIIGKLPFTEVGSLMSFCTWRCWILELVRTGCHLCGLRWCFCLGLYYTDPQTCLFLFFTLRPQPSKHLQLLRILLGKDVSLPCQIPSRDHSPGFLVGGFSVISGFLNASILKVTWTRQQYCLES